MFLTSLVLFGQTFKITLQKSIRFFVADLMIVEIIEISICRSNNYLIAPGIDLRSFRTHFMQKHNIRITVMMACSISSVVTSLNLNG